jgi:hypothetical protein
MNALLFALMLTIGDPQPPGPYVNVYHDDHVAFQVRRDHIILLGEQTYKVWLRWLFATPEQWKGDYEVARVVVADLDCRDLSLREQRTIHRNREGQIYHREETPPERQTWRKFDPKSGSGAALARVCEFLPELLRQQQQPK